MQSLESQVTESNEQFGSRVVTKLMWRLIPVMIFLYILNYLDRVNVGVAKLQMNKDLGLDDGISGFGFSIFFIGYCFF